MLTKILWAVAGVLYIGAFAGLLGAGIGASTSAVLGATLFGVGTVVALTANFLARDHQEHRGQTS